MAHEFVEPGQSAQTIAKRAEFKKILRYLDEHPEVKYVVIYMPGAFTMPLEAECGGAFRKVKYFLQEILQYSS